MLVLHKLLDASCRRGIGPQPQSHSALRSHAAKQHGSACELSVNNAQPAAAASTPPPPAAGVLKAQCCHTGPQSPGRMSGAWVWPSGLLQMRHTPSQQGSLRPGAHAPALTGAGHQRTRASWCTSCPSSERGPPLLGPPPTPARQAVFTVHKVTNPYRGQPRHAQQPATAYWLHLLVVWTGHVML